MHVSLNPQAQERPVGWAALWMPAFLLLSQGQITDFLIRTYLASSSGGPKAWCQLLLSFCHCRWHHDRSVCERDWSHGKTGSRRSQRPGWLFIFSSMTTCYLGNRSVSSFEGAAIGSLSKMLTLCFLSLLILCSLYWGRGFNIIVSQLHCSVFHYYDQAPVAD